MEPEFWRQRWREGRTGFHEGRTNAFLAKHVERLGPAPSTVFVPLCGKSEDMVFLAACGHTVVGIDVADLAIQAFFREHDLEPVVSKGERFQELSAGPFRLLVGDFFALRPEDLGGAEAAYDRAAIVALPPEMRARYAAHMRSLLPKGARILTVTFEYDQARYPGPPFSVPEASIRSLYEGAAVDLLGVSTVAEVSGGLARANVTLEERCLLVTL